jgi:hypothetical protein
MFLFTSRNSIEKFSAAFRAALAGSAVYALVAGLDIGQVVPAKRQVVRVAQTTSPQSAPRPRRYGRRANDPSLPVR